MLWHIKQKYVYAVDTMEQHISFHLSPWVEGWQRKDYQRRQESIRIKEIFYDEFYYVLA